MLLAPGDIQPKYVSVVSIPMKTTTFPQTFIKLKKTAKSTGDLRSEQQYRTRCHQDQMSANFGLRGHCQQSKNVFTKNMLI